VPESGDGGPLGGLVSPELLTQFTSQGYFIDGDLLFVLVMPSKDFTTLEVIKEPLGKVRQVVDAVREHFRLELGRDVRIGITGRPVLQADEMQTTNDDMTRAVILALLGVLVLFMVFFRAVRRPLLTALALVVSIALTFGLTTVTIGHLNLLSIVFAVMLVSLGTEFGVHVIARYQEELAAGGTIEASLRNALMTAGKGNITGATTTAAAFYTTLLADFRGLSELGFIAGSGVLICMITMNTFLPALLLLCDRWRLPRTRLTPLRVASLFLAVRAPVPTLLVCGALLAAGLPLARQIRFNSNLLDLQAQDLPSVEFEKLIIDKSNHATWFAVYLVETLDEVRRIVEELNRDEHAEIISKVESVFDLVPEDQAEKLELIRELGRQLGAPGVGEEPGWPAVSATVDVEGLEAAVESLLARFDGLLDGTILAGAGEGTEELQALTEMLDGIVDTLESRPDEAAARLGAWQTAWIEWLRGHTSDLFALLDPVKVNLSDLPPFIKDRVVSAKTGSYLVYGYPRRDIWQDDNMEEFVALTRAVSEDVTGVPEQVYESTRIMKRGFTLAAIYSMIAVFFLVLIDFRSILFSALAMVPVFIGLVMTVQLMPLFGVSFNLANFFAIPIIIGGGINGGVHMIHRFREERSSDVVTRSTGTAIVLSQLSNILGFGMMLLAHHRGVASLGGLIVFGFSSCLFVSLVVLPAALKIVERRRYRTS
jgi:hopanoid biosynthesis associated RND transporter like protein HpnN